MDGARTTGAILMALAIAAFLGSTAEMLPAITFFPALALFAMGAIRFLVANHAALEAAEQRTHAKLHPTIVQDRAATARAERIASRQGVALQSLNAESAKAGPVTPAARRAAVEEIDLVDACDDEDIVISQDVSFPVEVQRGDALADQLRKLNQLLTQGALSEQEYALAKAKLLR